MAYVVDVITKNLQYSPQMQAIYHQPFESFNPQVQDARQYAYSYIGPTYLIDSPEASVSKKGTIALTSDPSQTGTWEFPTTMAQPQARSEMTTTGIDWTLIGLAALALGGGYLVLSSGGIRRVARRK
ncbi:hypothetical protein ES707_11337 [subsurface metagenome]